MRLEGRHGEGVEGQLPAAAGGLALGEQAGGRDPQHPLSPPGLAHLQDRAVLQAQHLRGPAGQPQPARQRLLEDERWLAFSLLAPTAVLLGFIPRGEILVNPEMLYIALGTLGLGVLVFGGAEALPARRPERA